MSSNGTLTQEKNESASSSSAHAAVFVASADMPSSAVPVRGFDFSAAPPNLAALLDSYLTTGFQATSLALAIAEINAMLKWRLSDEPVAQDESERYLDPAVRRTTKTTIFLSYTSNLVSSGLRESFKFLAQHKMVQCIVTTAGGVEEDLIKCLAPTYLLSDPSSVPGASPSAASGNDTNKMNNSAAPPAASPAAWETPGALLRTQGLNRIGNLVVPNSNYGKFEDWVMPILDQMLEEQKRDGVIWSPSTMIARLGKEINDESSIAYQCYKVGCRAGYHTFSRMIDITNASPLPTEQYTHLLPRANRRLSRRHDLLPLVPQPGPDRRHRLGHSQDKRARGVE